MSTALSYEDFLNPRLIKHVYFEEVVLKNATGAEAVMPWDYQVHHINRGW